MKKVKVTQAYIDSIKAERDRYKRDLEETKTDLAKHRRYFVHLFKEILPILGESKSVRTEWLTQSLAQHFTKVKGWTWGFE